MHIQRYSLLVAAVLFLVPQALQAQSFARADGQVGTGHTVGTFVDGPISHALDGDLVITHSKDFSVFSGGVRCGSAAGGYSTENSFYRVFDLSEYPEITDGFAVNLVGGGISIATWPDDAPTQTGVFRLYNLTAPPTDGVISAADLELVAEAEFDIVGPAGAMYVQETEISGAFTSDQLLAVEMFLPTGNPKDNPELPSVISMSQGGNDLGVTDTEYLASESCGITDPTDLTSLGEFDSEWVLYVQGSTMVVSNEDGAVAQGVTLGQSYPNPAVGRTVVPFTLEQAQHVRVAVYDALGREVVVAADQTFAAGEQNVEVNLSGLPTGLYVYRVATGEQTFSRKMVVLQ